MQGLLNRWTEHVAEKGPPNYTLRVDFLDHDLLKKLHHDLSNEGSNFILSLLEVGH